MFRLTPITRSPAQKPACKDLSRNGQRPAIATEAAYTPVSNRAGSRSLKKQHPSLFCQGTNAAARYHPNLHYLHKQCLNDAEIHDLSRSGKLTAPTD
ncbi:hypothetical protein CUC11_14115 [Lacticaseibacillus rhamnosus]|nr:hypothetical protein CUC11_14115 [Lacticaseibacillus rhamnosus]VTU49344.1 hypothetical protein AMBR_DPAELIID_02112 [Lacticaseibacillus rhamnosus]VTU59447.1 hypothetical protein AMBR_JPGBJEAN_02250 [Lacticaseibacillus rhamnosus]